MNSVDGEGTRSRVWIYESLRREDACGVDAYVVAEETFDHPAELLGVAHRGEIFAAKQAVGVATIDGKDSIGIDFRTFEFYPKRFRAIEVDGRRKRVGVEGVVVVEAVDKGGVVESLVRAVGAGKDG